MVIEGISRADLLPSSGAGRYMWSEVKLSVQGNEFVVSASTKTSGKGSVLVRLAGGEVGIAQVIALYNSSGEWLSEISYYYAAADLTFGQSEVMDLRFGKEWRSAFGEGTSSIGLMRVRHTTVDVSLQSFVSPVRVFGSKECAEAAEMSGTCYFEVSHIDADFAQLEREGLERDALEDLPINELPEALRRLEEKLSKTSFNLKLH